MTHIVTNPDGTCSFTNLWGFTEYNNRCSFFGGSTALPEGLGWFVVVGLGAVFSLVTSFLVWLDERYNADFSKTAEGFATAGRSVKTGLIACDIVSKWTWAATLLQSSNVAYKFGVSGPFWYASGATVQVLLFSIMAVEIKRKAPKVHTVLEVVRIRWGTAAHFVFMFFCMAANVIVTAMLILGGAAVMEALTGVNVYAAAFLIPLGVAFYTTYGGLRACFLASWSHVAVIYTALCIFMFVVYGTSPDLGSPSVVYDRLRAQEKVAPVAKNMEGSLLTFFSESGLIFGVINIIGNFGTVFLDQSYWQSAIAALPTATYKGYLMGGLCWFAIPFSLATTLGLAGRALDLPITIAESNAGLTPPAVAVHLMGRGGAFLLVLQLFLAVTSTASAEQIAVSTLCSYDIYRQYINKNATNKQMVVFSRIMISVYAILSGVFAVILLRLKLSLGWVYLFMGIVIGSAVFPVAMSITWKKVSSKAAITAAVVSMPLALMTWLVTAAKLNDGNITLDTTGQDYPMLAGNLVAIFFSAIVCTVLTFIFPDDFDWNKLNEGIPDIDMEGMEVEVVDDKAALDKVVSFTYKTGAVLTLLLLVIWPLLALPAKVFSQSYFTFWVILAIAWGVIASAACILLPIWEARTEFVTVIKGVLTCSGPPAKSVDPSVAMRVDVSLDKTEKK